MKTFRAKIIVRLKPTVQDSRGETLKRVIESLIPMGNLTCRVGTSYGLKFDAENQVEALNFVNKVAQELLTNNFSEEYEIRSIDEVIDIPMNSNL